HHCNRNVKTRVHLKANPKIAEDRKRERAEAKKAADEAAAANRAAGRLGDVICHKFRMKERIVPLMGYLDVYPNEKHQNRKDGYGCRRLSPKVLGPADHKQSGVPECKTVEGLNTGDKCYKPEVDEHGNPTQVFYDERVKAYAAEIGPRHKEVAQA